MQLPAPLPEYFPTGQVVQLVAPRSEYWPRGHVAQLLAPLLSEYLPRGQVVQLLGVSQLSWYSAWPLCEHKAGGMYSPASQEWQSLSIQLGVHRSVHEHE